MDETALCNEEQAHWYGITELSGQLGLFKIFLNAKDGWIENPSEVIRLSPSVIYNALGAGKACSRGVFTRPFLDVVLKGLVYQMIDFRPTIPCYAIVDYTRTCLPRLSGKAARDAFSCGQYFGILKTDPLWGCNSSHFGDGHELLFCGISPMVKDFGTEYYARLRREHPLLICWKHDDGRKIVHPGYKQNNR